MRISPFLLFERGLVWRVYGGALYIRPCSKRVCVLLYRFISNSCLHTRVTTHCKERNFDLCIPRNGTARPQSQFLHSCVCERFIYSHDGVHLFFLQRSRECINSTQKHECRNWTGAAQSLSCEYSICFEFLVLYLCSACGMNWP